MNRSIKFSTTGSITDVQHALETLAMLIRSLNMAGTPFSLHYDAINIEITIGTGY